MTGAQVEPASFRDPTNSVFYVDDRVLRGLDERSAADWNALSPTSFFEQFTADGRIVRTEPVSADVVASLPAERDWALVLEHERVPFVSYPYEWSFSQLSDAAVLHLEILLAALDEDTTMKDGYAFNVQWHGTQPVFIDIGSFEPSRGGPWAGYRQFCQTFLYPLMLQAYKDVSFQPFLRGQVNGLTPTQMRGLFGFRDRFRRGVFKNVHLHHALERRFGGESAQAVEAEVKSAGFSAELAKAMVRKLAKLVGKLRWKRSTSTWSDYQEICSYSDEDTEAKKAFVRDATGRRSRSLVWDLGCNEGTYSRLASEQADYVVAVDADDLVIDHLYRALRDEGNTRILPLVMDLTDPSPGLGWRGQERQAFTDRGDPDLVLALALVHHLAIAANVPLPAVIDWLRSFDAELVVEFVERHDPMAKRLLANKPPEIHADYSIETFAPLLEAAFDIVRREQLPGGSRTLFHAVPRV